MVFGTVTVTDIQAVKQLVVFVAVVVVEGVEGDRVEADDGLVRVLEEQVLALVEGEAEVDDVAEDPPGVRHLQVDLRRELARLLHVGAEDHVGVGLLDVGARDVAELDHVGVREDRLQRPLRQLVRVVLELGREDGAAHRVELLAPVDPAGELRVDLVQRVHAGGEVLLLLPLDHAVELGAHHQRDAVVDLVALRLLPQRELRVSVRLLEGRRRALVGGEGLRGVLEGVLGGGERLDAKGDLRRQQLPLCAVGE